MGLVAAIRQMLEKGLSIEQALMAAEVIEASEMSAAAELEARRAQNAGRQRRFRELHPRPPSRKVTLRNVSNVTPSLPDKEKSPTPPKEINPTLPFPSVTPNGVTSPSPEIDFNELADWFERQWNALASACGLGRIKAMTDKRVRGIRCRADDLVKALGFADAKTGFNETFNRIRGSPFLRGAGNGAGHEKWKCDVDWMLTESNFLKIHEGKYAPEPKSGTVHSLARR
jgi:hypothetical protein